MDPSKHGQINTQQGTCRDEEQQTAEKQQRVASRKGTDTGMTSPDLLSQLPPGAAAMQFPSIPPGHPRSLPRLPLSDSFLPSLLLPPFLLSFPRPFLSLYLPSPLPSFSLFTIHHVRPRRPARAGLQACVVPCLRYPSEHVGLIYVQALSPGKSARSCT